MTIAEHLRDRAESYWRDATTFREEGDAAMAVAYETISQELRQAALIDGLIAPDRTQ